MKDRYIYPAVFHYDDDGISVSFPDLPGCLTFGDTTEEALRMAKDAMGLWLYDTEVCGDPLPAPSDLRGISLEDGEALVLVDVFMPLFRPRVKDRAVKKTLTIPAWLNQAAEQAHVNFSQVLQEALKARLGVTGKP